MKKKNKVGLVILNFNDYKTTLSLIEKVKDYNILDKIMIIDNCSTNNSLSILKKYENDKIIVERSKFNGGYAVGNNFGVKELLKIKKCDYIIIANPDVIFEEKTVEVLIEKMEEDKNIGVIAPMMKPNTTRYYKFNYIECICSLFLFINKLFLKFRKKIPDEINFIPGSLLMFRTDAFLKVGGFDENTFLYCEEPIIIHKLNDNKYKAKIISDIYYIHNHSITIKKVYKSKIKPYKIYLNSLNYYLYEIIKINILQKIIFRICTLISYLERIIYDFITRIMNI